ncbi:HugZ family pyridoxamine 5'-phosphate oxidase [Hydrogenovibrio kuenenii]|uniref:HugZ family pyridoxamine 5'-phosphate oxidase n=1 Tax=Hydrogenovibrio kuenenii TaxID=63658 RepID=UPI0004638229|nr:pyridoxamine 5'-phosphate oxidase family protein [Hydrogenovibrio kuenenii]
MAQEQEKKPLASVYQDCMAFISEHRSAVLATLSSENMPEASYAPVLVHNHCYYILISELANHTQNLYKNPAVSLLFIEDEQSAENLFARKRATVKASGKIIARDSETWNTVLPKMSDRLGEMIDFLQTLSDFHLFELQPNSINFVRGFAQAYTLEGPDLDTVTHRKGNKEGQGHGEGTLDENI